MSTVFTDTMKHLFTDMNSHCSWTPELLRLPINSSNRPTTKPRSMGYLLGDHMRRYQRWSMSLFQRLLHKPSLYNMYMETTEGIVKGSHGINPWLTFIISLIISLREAPLDEPNTTRLYKWLLNTRSYVSIGEALSKKHKIELIMFRDGRWCHSLIVRSIIVHKRHWNCRAG